MFRLFAFRLALVIALVSAVAQDLRAGDLNASVAATVVPDGTGSLYSYTVTNLPSSVVNLGAFYLEISPDATLSDFIAPPGFINLYTIGDASVEFASTNASTDLVPGESGVFSFTADALPASGAYLAMSFDEVQPPATSGGTTSTPTGAVPEPGTLGLACVTALALLKRRRA